VFVDQAIIDVRSGRGGDGCVSYRREKYIPKGGPDGGDGGSGGDVVLFASTHVDTLLDYAARRHWFAQKGQPGGSKQKHGRDGADLRLEVPPATMAFDDETGELLADLKLPGEEAVIARGGRGGFGNEHFKSPTNQTPSEFTPGEPAEQRRVRLELKLIADVGLVGKPNAGKSTLLSHVTRATPKIGDYPFTTIGPQLGIAEMPSHRRMVVADLPGLIEHAAEGAGLGHQFLRHVERTRILLHVIELEPSDGTDPLTNYRVIRRELQNYAPALAEKPEVIGLSKMDLFGEDVSTAVQLVEESLEQKVHPFSAATGNGLAELLEACWSLLDRKQTQTGSWSTREGARP
jgi:GTP-binding protein